MVERIRFDRKRCQCTGQRRSQEACREPGLRIYGKGRRKVREEGLGKKWQKQVNRKQIVLKIQKDLYFFLQWVILRQFIWAIVFNLPGTKNLYLNYLINSTLLDFFAPPPKGLQVGPIAGKVLKIFSFLIFTFSFKQIIHLLKL